MVLREIMPSWSKIGPMRRTRYHTLVRTSLTPVGNSADSPQPILRPSPVTGLDLNIFGVEKTVCGL
jgi:hypothetical protein